jgi:hypothetical protein
VSRAGVDRSGRERRRQWALSHGSVSGCRGRSRARPRRGPDVRWAPGPRATRGAAAAGACCVTLEMQGKRSAARPCEGRGGVLRAPGRATATKQRGKRRRLAAANELREEVGAKHTEETAQNAAAGMNNRRPSSDLQHRRSADDRRARGLRVPGVVVLGAVGRPVPAVASVMQGETGEVSEGPLAADGAHAAGSRSGVVRGCASWRRGPVRSRRSAARRRAAVRLTSGRIFNRLSAA